ncbi:MAG: ABC transporter permease [Gemmatimonadota bacterium]
MPRPDGPPRSFRLRCCLWIVRVAFILAPRGRRKDLGARWEAELLHRWRRVEEGGLFFWSLGAFRHAWYLLRTEYTMDLIWQDAKYGVRALKRSKGLIAIAVLSLAIGIGANTAIFSAVDVFMLRPLPYPDSDRLHMVWTANQDRGWTEVSYSVPDFLDLRERSATMDMAALRGGTFNLSGDFEAERLRGAYVTPGFFGVLGIRPPVGRAFSPEEGIPGNERVAIISHGLWERRFGADPGLVGSDIILDGVPHTVVGVMPPRFWFRTPGGDVMVPLSFTGEEHRGSHNLSVLARIREGSTPEQALGEAQRIMGQIGQEYPETSAGHSARMVSLHEDVFDEGFKAGTLISTVAVALVLLIACANVANLLLTHAAGRDREVALRGALGAGRSRIVRQFLTEATIVAVLGGLLGLGLAVIGIRGLVSIMPAEFPRVHEIGLSPRVLGYTAAITMLTGLLFGLAPALNTSAGSMADALREGGRGGGSSRGRRLRKGLVVAEVALAVVLMISSVLLVQGFARIRLADLGFDRTDVLTLQTLLPVSQYGDTAAVNDFNTRLLARLEALPGVQTAAGASALPLQGFSGTYYVLEGQDYEDPSLRQVLAFKHVLPGYFEALDIPLLQGRRLADTDRTGAPAVVVINETLARRHWPDSDPIGRQLILSSGPREVVGVVGDTRDNGADASQPAMMFLAAYQSEQRFMDWAVEATVPLGTLVEPVRAAVRAVDPSIPTYDVMSMDDLIELSLGGDLIMAKIMSGLAFIALVLALGGVYGVMAYTVSLRTRELGIRLSLGAQRSNVLSMVVRQGTTLALLGVGLGVVVSLGVTRGLSRFLFGVSPFDPVAFASVAGLLFVAGVVATFFPARRATKVDPLVALRVE